MEWTDAIWWLEDQDSGVMAPYPKPHCTGEEDVLDSQGKELWFDDFVFTGHDIRGLHKLRRLQGFFSLNETAPELQGKGGCGCSSPTTIDISTIHWICTETQSLTLKRVSWRSKCWLSMQQWPQKKGTLPETCKCCQWGLGYGSRGW